MANEVWMYESCFPEELQAKLLEGWESLGENRPYLGGWRTFLLRRRIS